jgi:aerotaxis receptor
MAPDDVLATPLLATAGATATRPREATRPTTPTPIDRERTFRLAELFFSTTTPTGIITFGNGVFVRVSGYASAQLVGAPHSIIRHPEMPRVVFALLWEHILAGIPIAAYVKNLAADGSYYWVLAMVTPITEGFLSIRLKPSTDLRAPVAALYGELRRLEAEIEATGEGKKAAIERAREHLATALAALGFPSYDAFMHQALVAEVSNRTRLLAEAGQDGQRAAGSRGSAAADARATACATLTVEVGSLFERLGALLELDRALAQQAAFVRQLAHDLHLLALNAQIRAASLGSDGQTLRVVAEQMSGSARATSVSASEICACIDDVNAAVRAAAFRIATSHLSVEMMADFVRELDTARAAAGRASQEDGTIAIDDARHRVAELAGVVAASLEATGACIRTASRELEELQRRLDALLREVRTLQILHITGRVESVRCERGHDVSGIFGEVLGKTGEARENLALLMSLVGRARMEPPKSELIQQMLSALVAA